LNLHTAIFLFFAGALGGAINAVAGGGSFVSFPALLFTGVPAIPANATNTLALWVGTTASGGAYREKLNIGRRVMIPLVITSVIGGLAGAFLLIKTPAQTFLYVLPWLLLGATLLFAFSKHLTGRISADITHEASNNAVTVASIYELFVAVFGGYFGGGVGLMTTATYGLLAGAQPRSLFAVRTLMLAVANCAAAIVFIGVGLVHWALCLPMLVGSIVGGWAGAKLGRTLSPGLVRAWTLLVTTATTIVFFVRAYG